MWAEIVREMRHFDVGVVCSVDDDGYPISFPCHPVPNPESRTLRFPRAEAPGLTEGQASLLFAKHDERLVRLRSFLAKGKLTEANGAWSFTPMSFVPGQGIGGLASYVRFLRQGRKGARTYLERRSMDRPQVDWNEIVTLLQGRTE